MWVVAAAVGGLRQHYMKWHLVLLRSSFLQQIMGKSTGGRWCGSPFASLFLSRGYFKHGMEVDRNSHQALLQVEQSFFFSCSLQTRIYHCIQYTELHALAAPYIPESLRDAQQNQTMVEQRTTKKVKKWNTISGVVKPTLKSYMQRKNTEHIKE